MNERDLILASCNANIRDAAARLRAEVETVGRSVAAVQFDAITGAELVDVLIEHLVDDLYANIGDHGAELTQALTARIDRHKAARNEELRLRAMPQQVLLKNEDGGTWIVGAIDEQDDRCTVTLRAIGVNPFDHLDGLEFVEETRGDALAAAAGHVQAAYDLALEAQN